jgi:RNA polymerase sigma-70 factor (ECF subfamily)
MDNVLTTKESIKEDGSHVPDLELVNQAQTGDARAFELLFDRYYDMMHAFAYRLSLVEAEADDIAQETFIRAARGIAGYRRTASFKNWLYRIAHNVRIDAGRRAARHREGLTEFAAETVSQSATPEADYGDIHRALKELPGDLREAVVLVYFEAMNHRDAAKALGCAETTVSWRIFRAKRKLKKLLRSGKGDT